MVAVNPDYFARCRVLLFRGRGLVSTLIRWQTRGTYSHAALLTPDGSIIESWQGSGVRVKTLADWEGIDSFAVAGMTSLQWEIAINHALGQVGKRYDYGGVFRFLTRQTMEDNGKLFCSELVFESLQKAGINLLARIEPWAVSPSDLSLSTLLHQTQLPQ